jgi:large subunit ribosomal protein L29
MKAKDLRSMPKEDLDSKLIELKKELIKHNAQIATGTTPKSPGQIKQIKKTIAKIMTIVSTPAGKPAKKAEASQKKIEEA